MSRTCRHISEAAQLSGQPVELDFTAAAVNQRVSGVEMRDPASRYIKQLLWLAQLAQSNAATTTDERLSNALATINDLLSSPLPEVREHHAVWLVPFREGIVARRIARAIGMTPESEPAWWIARPPEAQSPAPN